MKNILIIILLTINQTTLVGQEKNFPKDPQGIQFVTSDIENFWTAFDSIDKSKENPFKSYIKNGTLGLQGFLEHRIINADSMLIMAKRRKLDYEKIRGVQTKIIALEKKLKPYFYALEYWYPYTEYPPVFFVVGRFNSGGNTSEDGLLIGIEKFENLDYLPEMIIHESYSFPAEMARRW